MIRIFYAPTRRAISDIYFAFQIVSRGAEFPDNLEEKQFWT
jgi:hypothetical protein